MPTPCTVTGNLQTLSGNLIAQGRVIFQLTNTGSGNPIGVSGTSIIPALTYSALSAADGSFTVQLWGNDVLAPANTLYAVTFRDQQGNQVGPILYSIIGASANLNTLVATSTVVPPVLLAGQVLTSAAPTVVAGQVGLGSTTATTATAGANGDVPAQVVGYLIFNVGGVTAKVPYYAA
jgi:hypothetical protein